MTIIQKGEPMEDSISRQEAIDILDAYQVMIENDEENPYSWARLRMSELPSAQPERKKGKWILAEDQNPEDTRNGNYLFICSNCLFADIHAKTAEVPFCWHCGADMRGEKVPSAEPERKWIPCSERLPEDDTEVIVSCTDDSGDSEVSYTTAGWHFKGVWVVGNEISYFVRAWMPLPESYRGDEHENNR